MLDTATATPAVPGTDRRFARDVRHLGQYVGQLHDDLEAIAKTAGEAAHSGAAAFREGGKERMRAARSQGDRYVNAVRGRMAENPTATLGIAVGIGVIIGLAGAAFLRGNDSER